MKKLLLRIVADDLQMAEICIRTDFPIHFSTVPNSTIYFKVKN